MQKIDNFRSFISRYHGETNPQILAFLGAFILGKEGVWLAGGALRRTIMENNPSSDWDIFFQSKGKFDEFIAQCEKWGMSERKETNNHVQFLITMPIAGKEIVFKIQAIKMAFYSSPENVIESFDYTLCQFITDGEALWAGDSSLYDLGRKRLVVNKITYPVASLRRLLKYTNQGFYACGGCLNDILSSVARQPQLLDGKFQYID